MDELQYSKAASSGFKGDCSDTDKYIYEGPQCFCLVYAPAAQYIISKVGSFFPFYIFYTYCLCMSMREVRGSFVPLSKRILFISKLSARPSCRHAATQT